jgi:DNA-binding CsgD family transcriptional regulator/tetratricopeptide (TPR) repeat protein
VVARAGSVMGRCFVPDALAGCLDRPAADLDAPLAELVDQGFLYPFAFLDRGYYDFRHQLLRDALYDTVPPAELRRLHARAAEFGALMDGSNDVHASLHYERAGMRTQAYRAALAGAQGAAAISSRREAYELYRRAVANVPDGLGPAELAALYEGYLGAALDVDDIAVANEVSPLVRGHHLEAGMALEAAMDLVTMAATARRDLVDVERKRRLVLQAQDELMALEPSPDRHAGESEVHETLGAIELQAGRLDEAEARFREARRLALASSASDTTSVDYLLAEVALLRGDVRPALGRMLDLAREARAERRETMGVGAYRWAAVSAVRMMEHDTAHHAVEEGLRYAAEIEQSYCRHSLASASAQLAWAEGRWDDAVAIGRIEVVEPGSARGRLGSRDSLGLVAMGRGEVADARALLEPSLDVLRASGEVGLFLNTLWGLAETDLVAGEPEAAFRRCEEAVSLAAEPGLRPFLVQFVVTGARAAVAARRPADAERWVERLAERLEGWDAMARPALDHAAGLVRLATGSTGAARSALAAAVTGWDARGRVWEATWARLELATCLVRMNRHADAVPLVRDVEATADRLGSVPLRDRARTLLSRARSRATDDEPWRPLTVRELEVARLVAKGWTNNEIAEELSVAPRTVNAHLEHILGKLGVGRRAEVAAWVSGIDAGGGAGTASGVEAVAGRR